MDRAVKRSNKRGRHGYWREVDEVQQTIDQKQALIEELEHRLRRVRGTFPR